ncbi:MULTISPECIES: IS630 family transposase [unclassified Microcoleus]|uniref:IS630 family transposase n=1 Tax=unclassified Microcoleus TaxID=2642155 RepID=UPI002FD51273
MSEQHYLQELSDFIDGNPDPIELKRALAVRMWIEGVTGSEIKKILNVSATFISQSKMKFIKNGVEELKLRYQGSKAYLSPAQRLEIVNYLNTQEYLSLQEFQIYIEDKYDVRFKSNQSYYTLLDEAKVSWKKTQKSNPKKNDELVKTKKIEIEKVLAENRLEIEAGRLVVYMIDECHLLWGDVCGYVWGKKNKRIEVPMTNQRERQTYFGALNYQTKKFFVQEYEAGNSKNTVLFVKYLQNLNKGARILIFWDGASYHKYAEMREYLGEVNQGLEKSEWLITCELFAPNAPEQNPVEDIWLQGKKFLREHWYLCKSFPLIKKLFMLVTHCQIFDFSKLYMYDFFVENPELIPT